MWLIGSVLGLTGSDSEYVPDWIKALDRILAGMEYVTAFGSVVFIGMSIWMINTRRLHKQEETKMIKLQIKKAQRAEASQLNTYKNETKG